LPLYGVAYCTGDKIEIKKIKQMEIYKKTKIQNYTAKSKTLNGIPHLVVPVVMMKEGVHNGSLGPIFHSITELGKIPCSWDGIPVTVNHPQDNGQNVSANSPAVLESYAIGKVFNTRVVGDGLKADAWLEADKLETRFPALFEMIQDGAPVDVSVGVFSEYIEEEGDWNGEHYDRIAINNRPDHLALLPNDHGACGWKDGCGIRNNNENKKDENMEKIHESVIMIVNKLSIELGELQNKLYRLIDSMDIRDSAGKTIESNYMEAMYDDSVIYRRTNYTTPQQVTKFFKQMYSVDAENNVTFEGDPEEVIKSLTFKKKSINTNKMERTTPCCKEKKIDQLIQSNARLTEDDRVWLSTLEESDIERLIQEKVEIPAPVTNQEIPEITKEKAIEVLSAGVKTVDELVAILPDTYRLPIEAGLQLNKEKRQGVINAILANSVQGVFTQEVLERYSDEELNTFSKAFKPVEKPADYSGLGEPTKTPQTNKNSEKEEILLPL
jgi:hypothetical protein